jgi:multidrug efflux pump subunit AcrA (membrane-fusion protein)
MNYVYSDFRREAAPDPENETRPSHGAEKRGRWRGWTLGLGVLVVLAAALAFGAYRSYSQNLQAVATTQQRRDFVPTLRAQAVRASGDYVAVTLPATTAAFSVANIFARASGYIDKRNVDIGDHVKEGQLLVQIVAPELDHQIA